MNFRIVLNVILFVFILFFPWWIMLFVALMLLALFDGYELIGWGLFVSDDPLTAVVRGTGIILEDVHAHRDVLIPDEDDLS